MCDGDGCTASDLALFDYKNIRRPLYPFDMDMQLGRNDAEAAAGDAAKVGSPA
jgi:hypothetical protein